MPSPLSATRPRVAYLITNSEIGGAQTHVADLLTALRDRIEPVLLAGGSGPLLDHARAAGARTERLPLLDNALSPLRALAAFRQLLAALRAAAPDLIHTHSAKAGALGRLAGWLLGVPVVYTVHGFAFKAAAPARQRLAARAVEWLLAPLTTRLICVAQAERELAAALPLAASRISVIRNGIADTPARATPGAPLRRIVMVARLAAPKRADLAIRAFARAALPDCELVIAGEGPQLEALRTLAGAAAPGRIRFAGAVADVPALLASAQAFLLASDHEGFPLSVLEAMRAGLPVAASDLPGIREQLDDGACGLLVPGNDEATWAAALQRLAGDASLRAALGQAARARWAREFGLAPMAEATWAVYQQALAGRHPAVRAAASSGAGTR
ncbi:glycosyltransferase family 4 protein [Cupriavidus sp. 30B13]|uniref:glycosyltransferase family 4 protein n=1 Tax=Cupriavidus sp. 30B13 TaxID=3384241 RepID=UPI003B907AB4